MLQLEQSDDYVIVTNETHTVREFIKEASGLLDLDGKNTSVTILYTSARQKFIYFSVIRKKPCESLVGRLKLNLEIFCCNGPIGCRSI